jgi:hypothetical protein
MSEYYCDITDYELKFLKDDEGNIDGGAFIMSSFYTYKQADECFYPQGIEYNGQRYGWIIPQESRDLRENVIIYDLNTKKTMNAVKNPGISGDFDISIDVLSCVTNKSKLYFAFKLFRENVQISIFNRRNTEITPKKKARHY